MISCWVDAVYGGMKSLTWGDLEGMTTEQIYRMQKRLMALNEHREAQYQAAKDANTI